MALLRNAARYRERGVKNFYLISKEAVREHRPGQTFAFLILPPGDDPGQKHALARLEAILNRGGVEILRARSEFEANGRRYPADTRIILMRQPYGVFAKALLERRRYPDLHQYHDDPPIPPCDVTAHALSLLVGATTIELTPANCVQTTDADLPIPPIPKMPPVAIYKNYAPARDEGWTRWVLNTRHCLTRDQGRESPREVPVHNLSRSERLPANPYPARLAGRLGTD
jgi:hypothetical protein